MPQRVNILEAMFDIRPIPRSGIFGFPETPRVKRRIDLRPRPKPKVITTRISNSRASLVIKENSVGKPAEPDKSKLFNEFEKLLSEPIDLVAELSSIGGSIYQPVEENVKLRQPEESPQELSQEDFGNEVELIGLENFWVSRNQTKLKQTRIRTATARRGTLLRAPGVLEEAKILISRILSEKKNKAMFLKKYFGHTKASRASLISLISVFVILMLGIVGVKNGLGARDNIIKNGSNAAANLESAKESLKNLDFLKAADDFALAYDDFERASSTLGQFGASLASIVGEIPGLGGIKTANNIVRAGQLASKAGENLSLAFGNLYKSNLFALLTEDSGFKSNNSPIKLLSEFKDILRSADLNISKAQILLGGIDESSLTEDKINLLRNFKSKIPEFDRYVTRAIGYSDIMLASLQRGQTKNYLLLLQNNSELRATGGFPGTYALATFSGGQLKNIFLDDVYNSDGQSSVNVIPPKPLQHITPNWGMRDANWFADFPTSAKKIEEFYKINSGQKVDGVITITPDLITRIMAIIGPIEMPEYNLVLNSENFITQIQDEVEYGENRAQPKTVLKDFQPRFLEKIKQQSKNNLKTIFGIIAEEVQQKHILAYFNDPDLQKITLDNNIGGQILKSKDDYLQVVISNIKGSKTDAVTDSTFSLKVSADDDSSENTLTITRQHNGGNDKYGFYNKVNSSYIRIYVPESSILKFVNGQSLVDFAPLLDYSKSNFKVDKDLYGVEQTTANPAPGVDVFNESGKTVFGFWMLTKPGEKKVVTLKYLVPGSVNSGGYSLLWQKQSGTKTNPISFDFVLPESRKLINRSDNLSSLGGALISNTDLASDREFALIFK